MCIPDSLAGVKRRRNEALTVTIDKLPDRTVFGHTVPAPDVLARRQQAHQLKDYNDTIEKYDKVKRNKSEAVQAVLDAPSGERRLSRMDAEQLKRHERRTRKQRKVFSNFGFAVRAALAPCRFLRRLGGRASVFLAPGVDRTTATAYQAESSKSFCSCYTGTLPEFVRRPDAIGSRCVIIVPSLLRAPDDCVMAAMLLGAQLAEHVLVPGLHFKKIPNLKVMCTQQFVDDHRSVCKVLQKSPTVQWLDLDGFVRSLSATPSSKRHVLLRAGGEDATVHNLPALTKETFTLFRTVGAGMPKAQALAAWG